MGERRLDKANVVGPIPTVPTKFSVTHWLGMNQIYPVDVQVLFPHRVYLVVGQVVYLPSKNHHTENRKAD